MCTHNFGAKGNSLALLKFGRAKNVQNLVRFRTTFDFDCEYLWNGWSYRQAENGVIKHAPCCVEQKNSELWLAKSDG